MCGLPSFTARSADGLVAPLLEPQASCVPTYSNLDFDISRTRTCNAGGAGLFWHMLTSLHCAFVNSAILGSVARQFNLQLGHVFPSLRLHSSSVRLLCPGALPRSWVAQPLPSGAELAHFSSSFPESISRRVCPSPF